MTATAFDAVSNIDRHLESVAEGAADGCLGPTHILLPNEHAGALVSEIERLDLALQDAERKAARYEWLRSNYYVLTFNYQNGDEEWSENFPALVIRVPEDSGWPAPWPGVPPEKFGEAVDRCIAKQQSQQGGGQ